jgi:hypothetical protein
MQPQLIADAIRTDVDLDINWYAEQDDIREAYNALRERLSNAGIIILMNGIVGNNTHRKLNIEEFRAITLTDEYAPLIFINSNDTQSGKLFSFKTILRGKYSEKSIYAIYIRIISRDTQKQMITPDREQGKQTK